MKKSFGTIGFVVLLLMAAAGFMSWRRFAIVPLDPAGGELMIDVSPGANFFSIRQQLLAQGVDIDPFAMRAWIKIHGASKKLRIGEYRIQKDWSRMRILNEILSGPPVLHKLIVKEGHNVWDVRAEFVRVWGEKGGKEFDNLINSEVLLKAMEVPSSLPHGSHYHLEGFLFPETYSYMKYDSPKSVIESMLAQFKNRALPLLKSHPWGATPEGRYRLLTLASVVEKESGHPEEQPLVASVFWNRLKKKMKLQSDPTTIYALFPHFDGNLKKIHLITPTAYNTYTLSELPAGPICNPGETAIRAVLHPADSNFLYFVGRGDGAHAFSEDFRIHQNNVIKFQLKGINPSASQSRPPSKLGLPKLLPTDHK